MPANINIEVHIFTSGMGGAGKTTALLNALSYFVGIQDENTSILIFDEGDNTDFAALWAPSLRVIDLANQFRHDYTQLSFPTAPPILTFEPLPQASKGFRWASFAKILQAHVESLEIKHHRIIALVDTGGALGPIIRNAGTLSSLNKNYIWHFFPWMLWTSNSLSNSNYIETTRQGLNELEESVQKYNAGHSWQVYPIHVFNPILNESSNSRGGGVINQIADFAIPNRNPLIAIDTLFAYKSRPFSNHIMRDDFFTRLKFAFIEAKVIDLALPPLDVYKVIGKTLNLKFLDHECEARNGPCGFSNIFCVGVYDRKLATVKLSPGTIKKSLEQFKKEAFDQNVAPITKLSGFFGEVFNAYHFNLENFYRVLNRVAE